MLYRHFKRNLVLPTSFERTKTCSTPSNKGKYIPQTWNVPPSVHVTGERIDVNVYQEWRGEPRIRCPYLLSLTTETDRIRDLRDIKRFIKTQSTV